MLIKQRDLTRNAVRYVVRLVLFGLLFLIAGAVYAQKAEIEVTVVPPIIQPGDTGEVRVTYSFPEGFHQIRQDEYFFMDIDPVESVEVDNTVYPHGTLVDDVVTYYGTVTLLKPVSVSADIAPGKYTLKVRVGYQLCNDSGTCFFPQKKTIDVTVRIDTDISRTAPRLGFFTILNFALMALLGGLLLNIMPCVLPVLSIKALSLVNQSQNDRRKILFSSYAYSGGILTSFLIMSVVVVVLKMSGELIGWGFQFQNPVFVIVLLSIVFVFSLSLFDVYVISPPGTGLAAKASARGGYMGSFLTGVMAVLLATPCTAPFLGAALGFAFSQPPAVIFLILMMVGLGLALPFLVLGLWPRLLQRIPKPGAWMTVFKTLMGFLLLGTAIYLMDVLYYQIGGRNLIRVLIFLVILAFSAWIYGYFGKPGTVRWRQFTAFVLAVVVIVIGVVTVLRFDDVRLTDDSAIGLYKPRKGWKVFDPQLIDSYYSSGKPIFVGFGAQWCWTCRVNESAVLDSPDILRAFKEYDVQLFYGDYTNRDETIGKWIQRFGRVGVPVYLFYAPGANDPIVLPELLTKSIILDLLAKIESAGG